MYKNIHTTQPHPPTHLRTEDLLPTGASCSTNGFPVNNGCSPPNMLYTINTHKFNNTCTEMWNQSHTLKYAITLDLRQVVCVQLQNFQGGKLSWVHRNIAICGKKLQLRKKYNTMVSTSKKIVGKTLKFYHIWKVFLF